MKYVIFKHRKQFVPIIFPDSWTHSEVKLAGATLISAGFFNITPDGIKVHGSSTSLRMGPNMELDSELLSRTLNDAPLSCFMDWT